MSQVRACAGESIIGLRGPGRFRTECRALDRARARGGPTWLPDPRWIRGGTDVKTNPYRSHPIAGAVAAAFVTAALMASVVESFEPAKLSRFYERDGHADTIALERRADEGGSGNA